MIGPLLEQARTAVTDLLTDMVLIERATTTTDDLDNDVDDWVEVYTGPGLVQDTATSRQGVVSIDAASRDVDALGYVCKVPVTVDVRKDDRVTVTASLDAPMHVGRSWIVLAVPTQAWALVHRCIIDPD